MRFEFATARRIIFGPGTLQQAAPLAAAMGNRALLVTGRNPDRGDPLLALLEKTRMPSCLFRAADEPTLELIAKGVDTASQKNCDVVIGMGGGSALDTGKAIAAMLTNPGDIMDYLEVIGRGKPLARPPAPYIAIPTTAGTGAEVTKNAVLTSPQHRVKVSLRSPMMLPNIALVDPELTYSMPPALTASTGMDAVTQILESYVSVQSNPLTDTICRDGLYRAARSLRRAYENGDDATAREDMAIVSLYGGLALANSKLGAVHGFAGPMGAMFAAPHGAICARLLPFVMEVNVRVLKQQDAQQYLKRYAEVARVLTGDTGATAEDGINWIGELCKTLGVPALSNYGITKNQFAELVDRSKEASSMKGNPVTLSDEDLTEVLSKAT